MHVCVCMCLCVPDCMLGDWNTLAVLADASLLHRPIKKKLVCYSLGCVNEGLCRSLVLKLHWENSPEKKVGYWDKRWIFWGIFSYVIFSPLTCKHTKSNIWLCENTAAIREEEGCTHRPSCAGICSDRKTNKLQTHHSFTVLLICLDVYYRFPGFKAPTDLLFRFVSSEPPAMRAYWWLITQHMKGSGDALWHQHTTERPAGNWNLLARTLWARVWICSASVVPFSKPPSSAQSQRYLLFSGFVRRRK